MAAAPDRGADGEEALSAEAAAAAAGESRPSSGEAWAFLRDSLHYVFALGGAAAQGVTTEAGSSSSAEEGRHALDDSLSPSSDAILRYRDSLGHVNSPAVAAPAAAPALDE